MGAVKMSRAQEYTYFPGCMIPFRLPHFELTIRKVLERLDVDMIADESHTCCPEPTTFTGVDFEAWLTVGVQDEIYWPSAVDAFTHLPL
jgi:heterodisulfide reductase subunit B